MSALKSLGSYRELTFRLSGDLVVLADIARRRGEDAVAAEADQLRERIEARRFTVAVVGEFKRGKSTFLNALLGAEVLPADVLPTSATLNRVTFGLAPRATLLFKDGRPAEVVTIDALAQHVTKLTPESEARAATIREAVVAYPLALCRNDVDLIDTPGLSDDEAMTDVTIGVLPSVDAAIVVLMADSPFSASEAALVERLRTQGIGNLLFVVTAIDRIRAEPDRERVLASIRDRLEAAGISSPTVWPVSGRDALEGRVESDAARVLASGFPALEAGLERFLTRSDGVALVRRLRQVGALCGALAEDGGGDGTSDDRERRPRLMALLDATEQGLGRQVKRWEATGAAVLAAIQPRLDGVPKDVLQVAGAVVARHRTRIVPGWQDKREAIVGEIVAEADLAVREKLVAELDDLGETLGRLLVGEPAEIERLRVVLGVVLPFVGSAVGRPVPEIALSWVDVGAPSAEHQGELNPGPAVLAEAMVHPDLLQLGRGSEKLDFLSKTMAGYNLPGQFAKVATAALAARLALHWELHPPRQWFQRWWTTRTEPVTAALASAQAAVRSLQREVGAWATRQSVLRERDEQERAFEVRRLGEFRERAEQVLEELRVAGF